MILVLNCGSQSIKWKLFDNQLKLKGQGKREVFSVKEYQKILKKELEKLKDYKESIKIIGHRVVHGGKRLREPTKITKRILKELEKFNKLAPLHNPFNIFGIKIARKFFPKITQIAIFDTEFYTDLPQKACIYPLPENLRKKYGFLRFGFHGISHEYVAKEAAKKIKRPFEKSKIITCHLGGGSSVTAIKKGRAVDTSMGFTPMEGVVMMTRAGDIDPGIILYLNQKLKISEGVASRPYGVSKNQKLDYILNYESGVKGICGLSDMRDVLRAIKRGNKKAKLALKIFVYSIQKYIAAYFAVLGGCDFLVFTGAIGSGSKKIRNMICKDLTILRNTKILSIKTDEELAIAQKIKLQF